MKDLIRKILKESEFDWADEIQGRHKVMDKFRVKNTRYTWTVVEELEDDKFMFKIRPKPDGKAFQELSLNQINHWLEVGNWIPDGREKYWYNLRESNDFEWTDSVENPTKLIDELNILLKNVDYNFVQKKSPNDFVELVNQQGNGYVYGLVMFGNFSNNFKTVSDIINTLEKRSLNDTLTNLKKDNIKSVIHTLKSGISDFN
jgi:hypothetical protein